ncbi:hypothetical protein [Flagellimonas algicola]|uniref:Lipoprotein n=1 Tax=Flagellimonas algicola TaxID=2583815 RepID=A0ABY2WJV9_9FLAO|nr:hypothetical protein [Allomuricauda algicola]TMU55122.1 hypothetical protein FGG15_13135 [Allomuricauda algicola]
MKKLLLSIGLLSTGVFMACSFDAEQQFKDEVLSNMEDTSEVTTTECFSCTAVKKLELKICMNRDSTYTIFYGGVKMKTINTEGLEGKTPKEFVSEGCQLDELDFGD